MGEATVPVIPTVNQPLLFSKCGRSSAVEHHAYTVAVTGSIPVVRTIFMKFNKEADQYLDNLYDSVGAKTWNQKYNLLTLLLGQCSFSHNPTDEQKVGAMEYEILEREGLYTPVLA